MTKKRARHRTPISRSKGAVSGATLTEIVQEWQQPGGPLEGMSDQLMQGFRETMERMSAGQEPTFKFTEHVPPGHEPCMWCCAPPPGIDLTVKPGYFRDMDVDLGASRFAVCANCAGTGIDLGLRSTSQLLQWRFRRDELDHELRRLAGQRSLLEALLFPRNQVLGTIERAIAMSATWEQFAMALRPMIPFLHFLDTVFGKEGSGFVHTIRKMAEREEASPLSPNEQTRVLQGLRVELAEAREKMLALLPAEGTEEAMRLTAAIQAAFEPLKRDEARVAALLDQDFLVEEFLLLLTVHDWWVQVGKPSGVYAEELVHILGGWLRIECAAGQLIERSFSAETVAAFTPQQQLPEELVGLTPELLANLHDCVSKFGGADHEEQMRRIALNEPNEIYVGISMRPGNNGISIIGPGAMSSEGSHMFPLPDGIVLWDTRVTVADIQRFIARIDAVMAERGAVDKETGERRKVETDAPPAQWQVDRIFVEPGMVMAVLPGMDPEAMRQQFDRPDEVAINADPFAGTTVLCHKRDLPLLAERSRVTISVLRRHGITAPEQVQSLPFQRVLEIRREIDRLTRVS